MRTALITFANEAWMHRCKIVHEENKATVENYTRTLAYDLMHKLKQVPWSLPSASRHLLDRDGNFFKKGNIHDVSSWLRRIQFGIQEIEAMEKRTSTDIRTWIQNGETVITAATKKKKARHNRDTTVTTTTQSKQQQQLGHFFHGVKHRDNVLRWLHTKICNCAGVENIFSLVLEYSGLRVNLQNTNIVCDSIFIYLNRH